ncbi:MAG: hypothetical protein LBP72_07590 [Dysgonamonadaceae bacterium]|nr:hypothetical protein [Dysgonamonadaceae bacterium]
MSRPHLQAQAELTKFFHRRSKLSPDVFFELLFYCASRSDNSSLSFMVSRLESQYGIKITKQSLDERFNKACTCFVKSVLREVIQEHLQSIYHPALFNSFHQVRIKDSTKFKLPAHMETDYRGYGGI